MLCCQVAVLGFANGCVCLNLPVGALLFLTLCFIAALEFCGSEGVAVMFSWQDEDAYYLLVIIVCMCVCVCVCHFSSGMCIKITLLVCLSVLCARNMRTTEHIFMKLWTKSF